LQKKVGGETISQSHHLGMMHHFARPRADLMGVTDHDTSSGATLAPRHRETLQDNIAFHRFNATALSPKLKLDGAPRCARIPGAKGVA